MKRGALFLLACVVAVVGGDAVPGDAGTVLLVLGLLVALAIAVSALFKAADRWSKGAGTEEPRLGGFTRSSIYGRPGLSSSRGASRTSLRGSTARRTQIPTSRPSNLPSRRLRG